MQSQEGNRLRQRIEVEFVEADVEIGFNLVDLAGEEFRSGHTSTASHVLHEADDVLGDIDVRLTQLGEKDRASFGPLIAELRREVAAAKSKYGTD